MFLLKHRVALYIPSTYDVNQPLSKEVKDRLKSEYLEIFARSFGGSSATMIDGCYIDQQGNAVFEPIARVMAFCSDEQFEAAQKFVKGLAGLLCMELAQESVMIEIDGNAGFVDNATIAAIEA